MAVPSRRIPSRSALTWLPLAAILALLVASAATGQRVVPSASAADVDVIGSVDGELVLDTAACPPAALAIGELVPGTDPWKTAKDVSGVGCVVGFGTTNGSTGAALTMLEDPAAAGTGPAGAMKCVGGACAGSAIADAATSGSEPGAGTSAFGAQLLAATNGASGAWAREPAVNALADAAATACTTATSGIGTCEFTFGAVAAVSDPSGAYQAQARLVVLAN